MRKEISETGKKALEILKQEHPDCMIVYVDGDTVCTSGEMEMKHLLTLLDMLDKATDEMRPKNLN